MKQIFVVVILLALAACTSQQADTGSKKSSVNKYSAPAFADPASFDRIKATFPVIENLFVKYAERNHFPAIAFGLIVGDSLVFSGAKGLSNIEAGASADTHTLFRIASMSKSFTALAILKLRDEGKLNLHEKVSKYITEVDKAGLLTTDAPEITILHLLTMSAGFPEDNPWGDRQLEDTDDELLSLVGDGVSWSNVAGVNFEYSNLGFATLGRIITVVSGMPYQQYITDNIMKPIGMTESRWEYGEVPDSQLALGYLWEDETFKPEPLLHDGAYGAMGGLISSIDDYAKYVALHLDAWPPRDDEETGPVRRSSIREMHQPWRVIGLFADAKTRTGDVCPVITGYGYGLAWRKDCRGNVRVSHSGGLPGFGSDWRIYPEYGIGIVSFSNHRYGAPGPPNAIALDTLIQLAGLKPRILPATEILEARKKQIIELLPAWNESQLSVLAENFFLDQSLETWQKTSAEILEQAGPIKDVTVVTAENQLRGTFTMNGEKQSIEVYFTLTPERDTRIQQLELSIKE